MFQLFGDFNDGDILFLGNWGKGFIAVFLAFALAEWHRFRGRGDQVRAGWLLALSMLAVWSHPALDSHGRLSCVRS